MEYIGDWKKRVRLMPAQPDLIADILADTNELNAIVGRSEIGKTNLALSMAFSLATGTPFLGLKIDHAVHVAYIGFEGDEVKTLQRIEKIEKQFPSSVFNMLWIEPVAPIFKLNNAASIDAFKQKISGMRVVIIDPVRYMVDGDYTKPEIATGFLNKLLAVCQDIGVTIVFTLYFKKMDGRDLLESGDLWSIKGATEWGDMCSTVLMLERTKQGHKQSGGFAPVDKDAATLYFAKTRHAIGVHQPIKLKFNRAKCMHERA